MKTTKTIDTIVREKLAYYSKQESSAYKRFIKSNTRVDRDSCIKISERIQVYRELIDEKI